MRYGVWVNRGQGYVADWFAGFVEAATENAALEMAKKEWSNAISVGVLPRPFSLSAEEFWGNVERSITVNNDIVLEDGRKQAEEWK